MPTNSSFVRAVREQGRIIAGWPRAVSWRTGLVAGAFSLIVCVLMLQVYVRVRAHDPLKAPELALLRQKLLNDPKNEQLKEQIRNVDLQLRHRHFRRLSLDRTGAWLAMGGALVCLFAIKASLDARQPLPVSASIMSSALTERQTRRSAHARRSVGGVGTLVGLGLLGWSLLTAPGPSLTSSRDDVSAATDPNKNARPQAFASLSEIQSNWPRFRGPGGNGVSLMTNPPLNWDVKSSSGIVWKIDVPTPGFNSPIIWSNRLFLSGGNALKQEVCCIDTKTAAILWRQSPQVSSGTPRPKVEVPEQTGYAASTMATDGRRVYGIFATGDLAAFNFDGRQVWATNLSLAKNPHGHATSLLTWEDRLLVQVDQGEVEHNASRLYALDGATGRVLWQRPRPVPTSWATPTVIDAAGKTQIVTLGVPWIIAYNVRDGVELWRAEGLANEVTPSPIFAGGLVFAMSPNEKVMAIRPDGQGDVTKTHIAWTADDNIPDISSPVSDGKLFFMASTSGMLTCLEATGGKKLWEHDLAMEINASLSLVGDRLLVFGTKGVAVCVAAAQEFKEIARNDLQEKVFASPAFSGNQIFVRGADHLFCIGLPEANSPRSN